MLLADTAFRVGKQGLRDAFLRELQSRVPGMAAGAARRVEVAMAAPALDSNEGGLHPVEFRVLTTGA